MNTAKLPHFLVAGFVIIFWLLFKPSAWRALVAEIGDNLSPDFSLSHLQSHSWQHLNVRQLLLSSHVILPLWVTLFVTTLLWLNDIPFKSLLLASCYTYVFSVVSGILGSLTVSVAFGIVGGAIGGILLSLPVGFNGGIIFTMAENIAISLVFSVAEVPTLFPPENPYALLAVLFGIFTASMAGSLSYSLMATVQNYSPHRQMGSVMIGVLVSSIMVAIIVLVTTFLTNVVTNLLDGGISFSLGFDTLIGSIFGLSLGFIWWWQTKRLRQSLYFAILAIISLNSFSLLLSQFKTLSPFDSLLEGIHGGIENALLYVLLFTFPYVLAKRIAGGWAGIIAGIFSSAGVYITFSVFMQHYTVDFLLPLILLAAVLGLSTLIWRSLLLYPFQAAWNLWLYQRDEKRLNKESSLLLWHTAFWDEYQYLPLFGLENYLVMVSERYPTEGQIALEQLSSTTQSWATRMAQIELDARWLEGCREVKEIGNAHRRLAAGELSSPVSALLRSFSRVSRDTEAALAQESNYNQRLALDAVEERLDGLLRELTRSSEPYVIRFRPIAALWRQVIADTIKILSEAVEIRQEINNPYIIGIPLTEHQDIFVGRSHVSQQIERLLLDSRCPPLLLYGQRRTGKTSLLNNLGKLLPSTIIPLFVDLQGPASLAKNYEGFLYNIGRAITASAKRHRDLILPPLAREPLREDPFTVFDEWLDTIEQTLDPQHTLLLSLDEFSALEHVFNKRLLDEDSVLGMFRHIIQHRPRFKILLSGSHTIDEFERWASYLINVQTVHISYLQPHEALQLIEHPVKDFPLRYEPAASQRIVALTRCHPALIQLMCAEIVIQKNKQDVNQRRLAYLNDVEAAIPGALQHGRFFFADIANNQVTEAGLSMLRYIAAQGEQTIVPSEVLYAHYPDEYEAGIVQLRQRELIEPIGDGYRFQVELIRRWFI